MDTDTNSTDKNRLISLAEAAELYGFSHNSLRRLVNRNRLEAKKIGNSWVTTPNQIEQYIRSRQEKGTFREDIRLNY